MQRESASLERSSVLGHALLYLAGPRCFTADGHATATRTKAHRAGAITVPALVSATTEDASGEQRVSARLSSDDVQGLQRVLSLTSIPPLAQSRDAGLDRAAADIADLFGLPLTVIDVGTDGLERQLELFSMIPKTLGGPGAQNSSG
jgi:hypothetical protein